MTYEIIVKRIAAGMEYTDHVLAIIMLGAMLAITPLYCSAAIVKAHKQVEQVPVLTPISAAVLTRAMTPVHDKYLHPVSMRLPPVLPRRHR